MPKVAVMLAPGFEECEALLTVDILRRAEIACDTLGLLAGEVPSARKIGVLADKLFEGTLEGYDAVVMPGGYGGATAMRDSDSFLEAVKALSARGDLVAAICAAPIGLDRAGLLEGKRFTCYPGVAPEIATGTWVDEIVVRDGNLLTSQGPASTFAFAYALVEALGGDAEPLRESMLYTKWLAR